MKQKILAFITNGKKILALKRNPHEVHAPKGGWFTVSGALEKNEDYKEAAIREVKEETGLDTNEILDLNWSCEYNWRGEVCFEKYFLVFISKKQEIKLDNIEVIDYEWLCPDDFASRIDWYDDKLFLQKVLEMALKREIYFKTIEMKRFN
jgi:8-oxo-dGTP pyrophosphatase MutT (NUDIX family)